MKVAVKTAKVAVPFSTVSVGDFFYESIDGHAILKTEKNRGKYQRWGSIHEPRFGLDETVYVEKVVERTESAPKNFRPLSVDAISALTTICREPIPRQEFNPGVTDRLTRDGLAKFENLPSPYKTHRKKRIPHLVVTDAGREKIRDLEKPL